MSGNRNSEDLKNRTESLKNVVQAVALVVAAGWVLFEWNKTIFPQEERNREKFERAQYISSAKSRIDLKVEAEEFCIATLDFGTRVFSRDEKPPDEIYPKSVISATIKLINEKSYPIKYRLQSVSANISYHLSSPDSDELKWIPLNLWPHEKLFGSRFKDSNILEPGASASMNMFQVTSPLFDDDSDVKDSGFVMVEFLISAEAIDIQNSEVIQGALKEKYLRVLKHSTHYDRIGSCRLARSKDPFVAQPGSDSATE